MTVPEEKAVLRALIAGLLSSGLPEGELRALAASLRHNDDFRHRLTQDIAFVLEVLVGAGGEHSPHLDPPNSSVRPPSRWTGKLQELLVSRLMALSDMQRWNPNDLARILESHGPWKPRKGALLRENIADYLKKMPPHEAIEFVESLVARYGQIDPFLHEMLKG